MKLYEFSGILNLDDDSEVHFASVEDLKTFVKSLPAYGDKKSKRFVSDFVYMYAKSILTDEAVELPTLPNLNIKSMVIETVLA